MKTDNYTTAKNFVQGYEANANNLRTDGIILVSYYTVIGLRAEYKNPNFANVLFLCRAGYSNTTRKHKSHVYSNASRYGYKVWMIVCLMMKILHQFQLLQVHLQM